MKSLLSRINMALIGGLLLASMAHAQNPSVKETNARLAGQESNPSSGTYTGHWYIKSGEEYILVRSGNIPFGLLKRNAENVVENIDSEGVKKALNFSNQSQIDGKRVDNNYFVIEEIADKNSASQTATGASAGKTKETVADQSVTAESDANNPLSASSGGASLPYRAVYSCYAHPKQPYQDWKVLSPWPHTIQSIDGGDTWVWLPGLCQVANMPAGMVYYVWF